MRPTVPSPYSRNAWRHPLSSTSSCTSTTIPVLLDEVHHLQQKHCIHLLTAPKMDFLDLAPELRNEIYELSLPDHVFLKSSGADLHGTGLLRVNRQIRHEAGSMWQPDSVFIRLQDDRVDGPLLRFARRSPTANRAIKHLVINLSASKILMRHAAKAGRRSNAAKAEGKTLQRFFLSATTLADCEDRIFKACSRLRHGIVAGWSRQGLLPLAMGMSRHWSANALAQRHLWVRLVGACW